MKYHPIIFSGEMVRAILEGHKTQTRRIMKWQPDETEDVYGPEYYFPIRVNKDGEMEPGIEIYGVYGEDWGLKFPYGQPGDRLWVREKFQAMNTGGEWWHEVKRDHRQLYVWAWTNPVFPAYEEKPPKWCPSIHMPREASRITLEIINVRVERLQQITSVDCEAEGVGYKLNDVGWRYGFGSLWNTINTAPGKRWDDNPWVWVIEFKVL